MNVSRTATPLPALLACLAYWPCLGCEPNLNERTFAVSSPRVLAVRSDPAEALPGASVTLTTLFVDANGPLTSGPFDWAFCDTRNPLANLGPVNPACIQGDGGVFIELGMKAAESGPMPVDACKQFGPDVPPAEPNEPPGRPVDPDTTGGYYEPVRLAAGTTVAIGLVRITCDVPGASPAELTLLSKEDHVNVNPAVSSVSDPTIGTLVLAGHGVNTVTASQRLDLLATWATCDPTASACTGSEGYAFLDPKTHAVVQAREEMRVSWFATGGAFDNDTTGRAATDPTPSTDNGWVAPAMAGTVRVWVVLRDDRGGVGWQSYTFIVR